MTASTTERAEIDLRVVVPELALARGILPDWPAEHALPPNPVTGRVDRPAVVVAVNVIAGDDTLTSGPASRSSSVTTVALSPGRRKPPRLGPAKPATYSSPTTTQNPIRGLAARLLVEERAQLLAEPPAGTGNTAPRGPRSPPATSGRATGQ